MPAKTRADLLAQRKNSRRQARDGARVRSAKSDNANQPLRRRPAEDTEQGAEQPRLRPPDATMQSAAPYRDLCQLLFAPAAEMALQLSEAGVVRAASAGARTVLGVAPRDLTGRLVYDCVAPDDRSALQALLTRLDPAAANSLTWTWPTRVPVEARAAAWPESGAIATVLLLRATSDGGLRLTSAPELAALFAHELNQPVTALLGTAQACRRLAQDDSEHALAAALDQLVVQAERAGDLVRRLRDFAKGVRTTRAAVDMHEAIAEALDDFRDLIGRQSIAVDLNLTAQTAVVEANRALMGQVLGNLIRNAIEAMQTTAKTRRRLTINTATRGGTQGGTLEIEIVDRGPGISVEGVTDLFQPFVSTKPHGTGLGLALTRAIVQAHGGRVWWKDRHGRGATFVVSFPLTAR